MKYTCFFDGACAPINPAGHMGIGAIIYNENGEVVFENSHYIEEAFENSNNVAEYIAFISVLEELIGIMKPNDQAEIFGDSQLVIAQMKGFWRIKEGRYVDYANEAKELLKSLKNVDVWWIPRGENTIADELSNKGFIERGIKLFEKKFGRKK